jgi:hypothetical protein
MIRFLLILSLISVSLFARLNPFEPVDAQDENSASPRTVTNLNSPDDGSRTVKIVSDKKEEVKTKKEAQKEIKRVEIEPKVKEKANQPMPQKEVIKEVKKVEPIEEKEAIAKEQEVQKTNQPQQKSLKEYKKNTKKVVVKKTKTKKRIVSKSKSKIKSNIKPKKTVKKTVAQSIRYNVLPLLTIDLLDKNLTIKTTSNYKLIRYYEEKTENKFVFDFQADIGVPTAKEELSSPYYQSYIVGNHPEEGYFRVVIPAKESVSNYKVMIKDNIGTIIRK